MTLKEFIDNIYSLQSSDAGHPALSFYEAHLGSLAPDEQPLASSITMRLLSREGWSEAISLAPFALEVCSESLDDTLSIVENLVLFKPAHEDCPEFLRLAVASFKSGDLSEAARTVDRCYRAKCLELLLLVRSEATTESLTSVLAEIENVVQLLHPVNDLLISAISRMSHREEVLDPFTSFLRRLVVLSRLDSESKPDRLLHVLRHLVDYDVSRVSGPAQQDVDS